MKKTIVLLLFYFSISGLFSQENQLFFNIQNLDINTEYADFGVTIFNQDKVLFASSKKDKSIKRKERSHNRMKYLQFYKGTISESGEILNISKFSNEKFNLFHESDITFANDGKTIYFTFNNYINNKYRKNFLFSMAKKYILNIFKATVNENGIVSNITPLPFNGKNYSISQPRLSPDGKTLFFISDMEGSFGGTDIYKVSILENGGYSEPENLGLKINTEGNEMFPYLSSENIFYFSSDGHKGKGGLDIFSSKLENNQFSQVQNLDKINYVDDDFAFIINHDLKVGYFSSVREGNKGNADIYSFSIKSNECFQSLSGIIKNNQSKELLSNVKVQLFAENLLIKTVYSNEKGRYNFITNCGISYTVKVSNTNYISNEKNYNSTNNENQLSKINFNLEPEKCQQSIVGIVKDIRTNQVLANTKASLIRNNRVIETTLTKSDGAFQFKKLIDCNSKYNIHVEHVGFESKTNELISKNSAYKKYQVNFSLSKIEEVRKIVEFITQNGVVLINTNTIHFDLNKSNLRDDSTIELNKVVRIMKNNPEIKVELNIHTDSRAPDDYNMRLSNDRASSTINYIISQGISPSRITGKGFGETKLVNKCSNTVKCTDAEHAANRRTEFIVTNK